MEIDSEIAEELLSSFEDHYDTIQTAVNKLSHNTSDTELVNMLFRSIHTIKGNASMAQVQPLVDFTHAIEETISSMRSGYFSATPKLCDIILTAVDRLKDLHQTYLCQKENNIAENDIIEHFNAISRAQSQDEIEQYLNKLSAIFYPDQNKENINCTQINEARLITISNIADHASYLNVTEKQAEDLLLFRILALQVDEQNHFWHKRTDQVLRLGIQMLDLSNSAIDKVQFTAAVYMHDVGMAFISEDIVNKTAKLNPLEKKKLTQHPVWGYSLLVRMPPWRAAAKIVLEHHEHIDGSGYPYHIQGDKICDEAKIIAILDAYYAMTNLRADRSHRRSVLRAVSEINACSGTQFDSQWVECFNQVIRLEAKAGHI